MAKPWVHSESSAKQFGGKPEDYLAIHDWFDETKSIIADNRHRVGRHHAEGIFQAERLFGTNITNSEGKLVSVRSIGEQHVLEDFQGRFIPSLQDYIELMAYADWLEGKGTPPSYAKLSEKQKKKILKFKTD
jgi:Domain of unknown function (DUF6915)